MATSFYYTLRGRLSVPVRNQTIFLIVNYKQFFVLFLVFWTRDLPEFKTSTVRKTERYFAKSWNFISAPPTFVSFQHPNFKCLYFNYSYKRSKSLCVTVACGVPKAYKQNVLFPVNVLSQ